MFALIGTLKRPDSVSPDAFQSWWLSEHVPYVMTLPGLRQYAVFPAEYGFEVATGGLRPEPEYDGIALLCFESEQAMRAAFETDSGDSDREHLRDMGVVSVCIAGEPTVLLGSIEFEPVDS